MDKLQIEMAEALSDIAIALNSTLNLEELLELILGNVGRVVPHDAADIMLIESDKIQIVASRGYKERGKPSVLGMSLTLAQFPSLQYIIKDKKPLAIPDTRIDSNWVFVPETDWIRSYTGAPFWTGEQVIGLLNLNSNIPRFYNETHAKHLQVFAHHAGIAIQNARLLKAEREQRELAEALRESGVALNDTLDADVVLDRLLDQIARVVPYDTANVMLVENGRTRTANMRGYNQFGEEFAKDIANISFNVEKTANLHRMVITKKSHLVANTSTDPGWKRVGISAHMKSWVGAPILTQDEVVAFFSLDKKEPDFYKPEHAELLSIFASQASLALKNARLFDAEARRRHEAETLQQATAALTSALDLDKVLNNILIQLKHVVPFDSACIFLYQEHMLQIAAAKGFTDSNKIIGQGFSAEDELFKELAYSQQPVCLINAQTDTRFKGWGNTEYVRGWLGIPLIVRQTCIGYLTLDSTKEGFYGPTEITLGQTFANQAAIAIANAKLFEQTHIALIDTESLYQVSRALIGLESLPNLLQAIANKIAQVLPATWVTMVTLDMEAKQSDNIITSGPKASITRTGTFEELMDGLTGWAVREMKPALSTKAMIPDPRESSEVQKNRSKNEFGSVVVVPLHYQEKILGTITAVNRIDEPDFTERDVKLMVAMAGQTAISLENTSLFEAAQSASQLSNSLREIGSSLVATLDIDEVLNRILDGLKKVVPFDSASVMLVENGLLRIRAGRGLPDNKAIQSKTFPVDKDSLKYQIYSSKKAVIIPDVHQDPRFMKLEGTEYIRSWLGAPLLVYDKFVGILTLDHSRPHFYTQDHADIANSFAQQAAIALENARLFDETHYRAQQLAILNELAAEMAGLLEVQDLCSIVTQRIRSVFDYYNVAVFTADPATQHLVMQISAGAYADIVNPGEYRQTYEKGLMGKAARTGKTQIANDAQNHSDFFEIGGKKIGSSLAIPLKVGDRLIGVLNIDSEQVNDFDGGDVSALATVADQLAVAMEKARLFSETRKRAEQLEVLRQVTQDLTVLSDLDTLLYQIQERAVQLLGGDGGGILIYNPKKNVLEGITKSGDKLSPTISEFKPGEGVVGQVWNTRKPLIVNDYQSWPNRLPDWVNDMPNSAVGAPIQWGEEFFGVLGVSLSDTQRKFTLDDAALLAQFANQAAIAIQNSRLYEKEQKYAAHLEARVEERTFKLQALYELAHTLGHATQLSDVVRLTLLQLYQTVPHAVAASLLVTDHTNTLVIQSQHALSANVETKILESVLDTIRHMQGLIVDEATIEIHRIQPKSGIELQPALEDLGSIVNVPLLINNTVTGLLLIATETGYELDQEHVRLLHIVANQASATIERLQSLLAAEHQRLENLVAYLPNGIIMLDAEHRIVLANQVAQEFMPDLISATVNEKLTHLGPHPIEAILEHITDESFILELTGIPNQAFEITGQSITAGSETGSTTLVIRDITDERNIQTRIQQQERMAAVGQLAAGIAHDFNNILTGIIGYAELLLLNPELSGQNRDDIERITKQGHRAAHLVRQILDFSRQTITEKQSLDMVSFIKETIKLLERTIPEDIHISLDYGSVEYIIKADLTQMQQALTNLAVNARDAMPEGGTLKFSLSRLLLLAGAEPPFPDMIPGEWIALAVSDTGTGISPELQGKIFEPFFTTKEVGKGTGLGLAQVYGIIKQHEGHIHVKSNADAGTTFILYLPAVPMSNTFSIREEPTQIPRGNGEVILLVEDNASVLDIATTMLEHLGYKVLTATNGIEALEEYDKHRTDIELVLTDITMPKMGGIELTAALQQRNPDLKVIALTGYPLESDAKEVLAEGMIDWLQKPLSITALAQTVRRSL